jgi:hypothetical protein
VRFCAVTTTVPSVLTLSALGFGACAVADACGCLAVASPSGSALRARVGVASAMQMPAVKGNLAQLAE